ncbi:hypothetical protein VNO77_17987 [Canavalia gladiata]|uniref:Uncharacterized protein n=1 Tax=Canavalia gladiata TaxID=3824 RepID=A0AAN9QH70_CANGL
MDEDQMNEELQSMNSEKDDPIQTLTSFWRHMPSIDSQTASYFVRELCNRLQVIENMIEPSPSSTTSSLILPGWIEEELGFLLGRRVLNAEV